MAQPRGVILAAGRGVRMGGERPKTLIPVGDKEPLLHYIVAGLRAAGVTDVLVVTGHRPGEIQEFMSANTQGLEITYIRNTRFASWGNFHSVRLAVDQTPGVPLLVTNSDIVVGPDVYGRVLSTAGDLVLAVERCERLDPEDMRVELERDRVVAIGKNIKMMRSHGEFAGVSLLRPAAARSYSDVATDLEWTGSSDLYYEDVYGMMLDRLDARAAFVERGEYAEVDNPEDVPVAEAVITAHADAWAKGRAGAAAGSGPDA